MSTRAHTIGWTEDAGPSRLLKIGPEAEAANDSSPDDADLRQIVERARRLLDAAAGRGLVVSPPIVEAIVKIERKIATDTPPDTPTLAQFAAAHEALWKIMGGESAGPLDAAAKHDRRLTRRIYFLFFAALMLLAIPLTTISTVGGKLSKDIVSQIAATCRDYSVLYCDPATRNEETSYDQMR